LRARLAKACGLRSRLTRDVRRQPYEGEDCTWDHRWGLLGLVVISFVLRALWQIQSGQDIGYYNYKNQPMTYLGALASWCLPR
jgi:hypothetical protein